jgi:hypothetical protein
MSVIDRKYGCRIFLPRKGRDLFWRAVRRHYAQASRRKWKQLAMLWLRVYSDWPIRQIGLAFGYTDGHVTRNLQLICAELREHMLAAPEMLDELDEIDPQPDDPAHAASRGSRNT